MASFFMKRGILIPLLFSPVLLSGTTIPVQVVPQGIESVNGSSVTMGCTSLLVDSGGVMVCESRSYLFDGCSPDIDTSTSDWASQLVTVRRSERTPDIPFRHVVLTFGFDTAVNLTGIEMDLFNCPDWNIGPPSVAVYLNKDYNLTNTSINLPFVLIMGNSLQSSCDSLSTVIISGGSFQSGSYRTIYILVDLSHTSSIQWVHVGEVRFIGIDSPTCLQPTSPLRPTLILSLPSTTTLYPSPASVPKSMMTARKKTTSTLSQVVVPQGIESVNGSSVTMGCTSPLVDSGGVMVCESGVSIHESYTTHIETKNIPPKKNGGSALPVSLVTTTFVLLLIISVLVLLLVMRKKRMKVKNKTDGKLDEKIQCSEIDSSHSQTGDRPPTSVNALEFGNPTYAIHRGEKLASVNTAGTGIYSEVTRDKIYSEGLETNTTKLTASDGQVFTGMYNVVAPLTPPVRSASEIIESAAYACIQVNSDDAPGRPGDGKQKAEPQRQSSAQGTETVYADLGDATEGEPVERPQMYTDIQVREVPAVPMKSSNLQEYLDTQSALNISIYSESINPSDFTRNRMKGGGNDPQYLGPIYTMASSLPEIYQDPAEVTSENITEKTKLGDGQFGEVVLANTNGLSLKSMGLSKTDNNPNVSVTVAVKKLRSNPSQTQREAFEKEAQFMSHIKHPNVLRLLGVCVHDSAFIMMEYTEGGDLNQFLQSYSEIVTTSSSQTQITSSELVYIASQIASGMQYLASLKFVHRDLATRNCFITTNNSIKVGDVGVNTSLYQSSYYRIRGNRKMPIRWMATECFDGKFSEKSDVWAFGVTMWEMFTLAKQLPYRHLSDEEVIHNALKKEYRQFPAKPVACPQPVYDVMEKCWAVDMRHRLTFLKLIDMLEI